MVNLTPEHQPDTTFWRLDQNFHVYEDAERARGSGADSAWDQAAAEAAFDIRIEKAKVLDKARQELLEAMQRHNEDAMGFAFEQPNAVTRTVDGKNIPDDDIRL